MKFIKDLAEFGLDKSVSYQDRRGVLLTNYVSIILLGVVALLFFIRAGVLKNLSNPQHLIAGAAICVAPLILNRIQWVQASRLFVCIVPPVFLWYVFITRMRGMETIPVSAYDGLRVYLLAISCIPYLVLTRDKALLFTVGLLPSFVSIFFFEAIFDLFGVGHSTMPRSDAEFQQLRFVLSYVVISGGCYMLQSVILRSDDINKCLIQSLEEKTAQIKCQNDELMRSKDELARINQRLEVMVEERTRKISVQRDRILSYAYANAHYVRGPVARLLGLVELYKIDRGLDCDWLLKTVDRETRDIDSTIRKISAELQPID